MLLYPVTEITSPQVSCIVEILGRVPLSLGAARKRRRTGSELKAVNGENGKRTACLSEKGMKDCGGYSTQS